MKCGRLFFVWAFLVSFNSNKAIKLEVIEPKEKLVNEGDKVKLRCGTIGASKYCTFRHFGSETRICRMQWKKVTICKFDENIVKMRKYQELTKSANYKHRNKSLIILLVMLIVQIPGCT